MVLETEVTRLFTGLDQAAVLLAENERISYIDGLLEVGPYIVEEEVPDRYKNAIIPALDVFWTGEFTREDVRRAFQLAVLKGLKDIKHELHQVTPDSVALFIGYLVNKLGFSEAQEVRMLDLAVGTANLLTAVLNQYKGKGQGIGVDVDEKMIRLAGTNANLQQIELELYRQDALRPLLIDPVDIIVTDLPVGYYPDKSVAETYKVASEQEQFYSHHMIIEQAINHLKPSGFALFLIPNHLFEEDHSKALYRFIQEHAIILGLLQLPSTLFKTQETGKSVLLLRKKGSVAKTPNQILMAQLPSFTNKQAFTSIITQIDQWFEAYNKKFTAESN